MREPSFFITRSPPPPAKWNWRRGSYFPRKSADFELPALPLAEGGPLGCGKRGNRLLNARSNLPTPAEGRRRKGAISFGNPRSWKPPGERHPVGPPNEWL